MKSKYSVIDYLFWILLLLYSDPGGIQEALNINEIGLRVNLNDILFVILTLCFVILPKKGYLKGPDFRRIFLTMLIFMFYFFVVYGNITPVLKETKDYSHIFATIKLRYAFYCVLILLYIYVFFQRSGLIFIKYLFISSILVLIIYLQSIMTGFDILPNVVEPRGFININRNLMLNYGLMPLLIPLGISYFVFRIQTRYRFYIIIGFSLMLTAWLVSLTRRQLLGTVIYLIIALILNNFVLRGSPKKIIRVTFRVFAVAVILFTSFRIAFPTYLTAAKDAIYETFYVIKYGETTKGQSEERLKLSRPFIVKLFLKNPVLGTGFDNRWKNEEGDLEGYEASDYPFLGALAMVGILGILSFILVYILIIRLLYKDIKLMRKLYLGKQGVYSLLVYTGIIFFIFDLMKYTDYFSPISLSGANQFPWYAYLGLYLGASRVFRKNLLNTTVNKNYLKREGQVLIQK